MSKNNNIAKFSGSSVNKAALSGPRHSQAGKANVTASYAHQQGVANRAISKALSIRPKRAK